MRITIIIALLILTLLPISAMIIHPHIYKLELQGHYGGMFLLALIIILMTKVKLKKSALIGILLAIICLYTVKSMVGITYWKRSGKVVVEWLEANPYPGELKTEPPAIVDGAWCMPGKHSWDIARKLYWTKQ